MYRIGVVTAMLAMLMLPAATVLGEGEGNGVYPYEPARQQTQMKAQIHRATELIGKDLVDSQGNDIGEIEEIVLTPRLDKVEYVAVKVDDSDHDHHALKLDSLTVREDKVAVNIDRDTLLNTNGFSDDNWPGMEGGRTGDMGKNGMTPEGMTGRTQREPAPEFGFRRVSELEGMAIANHQGEDLGELEELMIDMDSGVVAYGIVSYGGFLGIGSNLSPVPWASVDLRAQDEQLVIDATRDDLEALSFSDDDWPDFSDRQYTQRVFAQYDQSPYWEVYGFEEPAPAQGGRPMKEPKPEKPAEMPRE